MDDLLQQIKTCEICIRQLPHGCRPVLQAHATSRIVVIGQAPGRIVHESGIAWDDKSGDRLREWMQVDEATFYDSTKVALIPMGFCYPGTGKTGDLPPRPECALTWHEQLLSNMKAVQLILLVGSYAQAYYLGKDVKKTLTSTVQNYTQYLPRFLPLPHPSPRNNIWLSKNRWFESDLLPEMQKHIQQALN